jgi:hypothetical protein
VEKLPTLAQFKPDASPNTPTKAPSLSASQLSSHGLSVTFFGVKLKGLQVILLHIVLFSGT